MPALPDRATLEARATELGIAFGARWKDETIADRIAEAEAALAASAPAPQIAAPDGSPGAATSEAGQGVPASGSTKDARPMLVTVTGPKKGRWRAGRHFTAEPVTIPADMLSAVEIGQLLGDPKLTVETREAD